jgi:hypothetical protein
LGLSNLQEYQNDLKAFKIQNGWNQPAWLLILLTKIRGCQILIKGAKKSNRGAKNSDGVLICIKIGNSTH